LSLLVVKRYSGGMPESPSTPYPHFRNWLVSQREMHRLHERT